MGQSDQTKRACCSVLGKLRKQCRNVGWEYAVARSKATASIYVTIRHRKAVLLQVRISNHKQAAFREFVPTLKGKKCVVTLMAVLIQAHAHGAH
jgi:hypothetical protein